MIARTPHLAKLGGANRRRCGLSQLEVLVATFLVAVSLVPALEALQTGVLAGGIHESQTILHHHLAAMLEEVLAQPFADLEAEALAAGGAPTVYSDAVAAPDRRLVFLSGYDGDDADADADPFTGVDPGLLWLRVEIEATAHALASLTSK